MYCTIQRTIQFAYPSGKDYGFRNTYTADGMVYTQPHTSFIGGFAKCDSQAEALSHIGSVWESMKSAYERDGWEAIQADTDSADITFRSPHGVLNIYTDWSIKIQK